jgi:hypothetical protein
LNNPYALQEIEKAAQISGIPFEGKTVVTKERVATLFDVTKQISLISKLLISKSLTFMHLNLSMLKVESECPERLRR